MFLKRSRKCTYRRAERPDGATRSHQVPNPFEPDDWKDNVDLPKSRQLPEAIPMDQAEMSACEDMGRGLSMLMDRYLIRCVCHLIASTYHQTRVSDFKKFMKKRLESEFRPGIPCGINSKSEVMDPNLR